MPLKDWYKPLEDADLSNMSRDELDELRNRLILERDEHLEYLHHVNDMLVARDAADAVRAAASRLPEDERNQVLKAVGGIGPGSSVGTPSA